MAFLAVDHSHCDRALSLSKDFGLSISNLIPTYSPANVNANKNLPGVSEDVVLDTTVPSNVGVSPKLFFSVKYITLKS
ncbi:hypothetical protein WH47_03257 [Habropoda laboriosa]|uniref:Uncharacterized protein n=1 Tax=Habropoda laboriosa TaxID=597456 RepID=A0A0L7RB56_9HYME|nr:hypothetical protein WH47_03257 [Habropoda laboriosa]